MSQYNPRFTLKSSKSEKKEIVLRIYYDYNTFTWDIKDSLRRVLKIHPKLWDRAKQFPVPKSRIPQRYKSETYNLQIIGETIDKFKVLVNQIVNEAAIGNKTINNTFFRKELKIRLGFMDKESDITIHQFCLNTIKEMEEGSLLINSTTLYSQSTIDKYIYTAQIFAIFKPTTTFSQINKEWYNGFILFLTKKQLIKYKDNEGVEKVFEKKDLRPGSISNYVKNLKFLMSYAIDSQISNNRIHTEKWFVRPKNDTTAKKTDLALNEKELTVLFESKPEKSGLSLVKDLFLIGCYTGLRISDFNKGISPSDFIETKNEDNEPIKILLLTHKKSKETIYIPLLWDEVKVIFEKYNFNLKLISDQTVNKDIKKVCKTIDCFCEKMQWGDTIGGEKVTLTSEKWKNIASHTGRRSFTTNMFKRGFTEREIDYLTGHKSKDMISLYDKLTGKEKAIMIYNKFKKSQINQ